MYSVPWAKLTMRMIPKIKVRPTPRKNSSAACDSALRLCVTKKASRVNPHPPPRTTIPGRMHSRRSVFESHLVASWRCLVTGVGRDDLRHRVGEPVRLHELDDVAGLHRLMIAFADGDMTLDVVDRDRFERAAQGGGVGTAGLLDAGGQHLQ